MSSPTFSSYSPVLSFSDRLALEGLEVRRGPMRVVQLNLGSRCNLACRHCHLEAGPGRHPTMSARTAMQVLGRLRLWQPRRVELTGGSPEMAPVFRGLLAGLAEAGIEEIAVRTNLAILVEEGQRDLPSFFRDLGVEVIGSLPCYTRETTDAVRGAGVFDAAIEALRTLNRLGYGQEGSPLALHLVHNPAGPRLPGATCELEASYRKVLQDEHGVRFHDLLVMTNAPVGRFARPGDPGTDRYLERLAEAFNPETVPHLMCRHTLSVDWRGELHDCDFHLGEGIPLAGGPPRKLWETHPAALEGLPVPLRDTCYACAAGYGSGCGGSLTEAATGS